MDELTCPLCGTNYDEFDRIPLMIPDCGHTFCRVCISNQLQQLQGSNFLCPEDNMVCLHRNNISQFPINCVLLKIFQNQRRHKSFSSPFQSNQQYTPGSQVQSRQNIKSDDDIRLTEFQVQQNNYCNLQQESEEVNEQPIDLCPEHFQKLDIVCLTDRIRICTKCALFGQHKQHEFRSVDDVVKEVTLNAENIMHIYQQIQNKQSDLSEQKYFDVLSEKFKSVLKESHNTVKEKFNELHQLLMEKENKITDQVNQIVNSLEQQYRKQISESIIQCSSSVELWKITAKDRLLYFSQATELGELPLDLYNSDYKSLEKGQRILEEIDKTLVNIEQKGQNIKVKKLRIDCKKKELEKTLDTLFTLTLQINNSAKETNNLNKENLNESLIQHSQQGVDQSLLLNRGESISNILHGDVFSSFCGEDPMLLKDVSLADWSDIQGDVDCSTESKIILKPMVEKNQQITPQKPRAELRKQSTLKFVDKIADKRTDLVNKSSFESGQQMIFQHLQNSQTFHSSPANKIIPRHQDENKVIQGVFLRSGISPAPKLPLDKKKKTFKINEKFDQLWQALKQDTVETVDFSNADLQDEGLIVLAGIVRQSKKIKTLKVVRNRITDEGACKLLDALFANQHQQFFSLHMQSNLITEKTLDYYIQLVKLNSNQNSLPKSIYLNQNLINSTRTKKKLDEIRKLGLTITV